MTRLYKNLVLGATKTGQQVKSFARPAAKRGLTRILACTMLSMAMGSQSLIASVIDRPFFRAQAIVILIGGNDFSNNGGQAPFAVDFYLLDNVTSGTVAPDIIGADGVTVNFNTGQFNASENGTSSGFEFEIIDPVSGGDFNSVGPHQTLDANDSYTAFSLDNNTTVGLDTGNRASRFLVVSNTAFDIYAHASDLVATEAFSVLTLENIGYRLRHQTTGGSGEWRWGENAQNPETGGSGIDSSVSNLSHMSAGFTKVFDGGRRTAASRGNLLEQAVGFQSRYNLRSTAGLIEDLSDYDFSMGRGELGATVTYTVYTP